jgi:hypothetical protein
MCNCKQNQNQNLNDNDNGNDHKNKSKCNCKSQSKCKCTESPKPCKKPCKPCNCPAPLPCPKPLPLINAGAEGKGNKNHLAYLAVPNEKNQITLTWGESVSTDDSIKFSDRSSGSISFEKSGWYDLAFNGLAQVNTPLISTPVNLHIDINTNTPDSLNNKLGNVIVHLESPSPVTEHVAVDFNRLVYVNVACNEKVKLSLNAYYTEKSPCDVPFDILLNGNYTLYVTRVV